MRYCASGWFYCRKKKFTTAIRNEGLLKKEICFHCVFTTLQVTVPVLNTIFPISMQNYPNDTTADNPLQRRKDHKIYFGTTVTKKNYNRTEI